MLVSYLDQTTLATAWRNSTFGVLANGNTNIGGTLLVNGAVTFSNTLGVTGATTLTTLATSGAATLASAGVTGALTVGGAATVSGKLTASGIVELGSYVTKDGVRYLHFQGTDNSWLGLNTGNGTTTGSYNVGVGRYALNTVTTGTRNVAVGYEALRNLTSATGNMAMGDAALRANTTGNYNMAIGGTALRDNTTGLGNVAIGYQASILNIDGNSNVTIGFQSNPSNTTGDNNVGIGYQSLYSNTGDNDVAIGFHASYYNTSGSNNVAVGTLALQYNQTGTHNVAIGRSAGAGTGVHSKSRGIFIGYNAGANNTSDDRLYIANSDTASPIIYGEMPNVYLGINAVDTVLKNPAGAASLYLYGNTSATNYERLAILASSGSVGLFCQAGGTGTVRSLVLQGASVSLRDSSARNVLWTANVLYTDSAGTLGNSSNYWAGLYASDLYFTSNVYRGGVLYFHTTGGSTSSMYFGYEAGNASITGTTNVMIGYQSGNDLTTGSNNVAVGTGAFDLLTTGSHSIAVGANAGGAVTTGTDNTLVGSAAGTAITTANYNSAFGRAALSSLTTGSNNTAVGFHAGLSGTTAANTTSVGYQAGYTNSTGANNTAVGYRALFAATAGNNTAHGFSAGAGLTTGANNVFFGVEAGSNQQGGSSNTCVGFQAGKGSSGHSTNASVYIGFQAGMSHTAANRLFIHNADGSNPLIYGEFDNSLLRVGGDLQLRKVGWVSYLQMYGYYADDTNYHRMHARYNGTDAYVIQVDSGLLADDKNMGIAGSVLEFRAGTYVGAGDGYRPIQFTLDELGFFPATGNTHDIGTDAGAIRRLYAQQWHVRQSLAEPTVVSGQAVIWQPNAAGTTTDSTALAYSAGDIIVTINDGATTKSKMLADFSAM